MRILILMMFFFSLFLMCSVEKPEDIRPALEAAFASGKTACINVKVDSSVISPGSVALANLGGYKCQ